MDVKTTLIIILIIAVVIAVIVLRGRFNRRRVQRDNDSLKHLGAGLVKQQAINESLGKSNDNAISGIRTAKEILKRAKNR